MVRVYKSKSPIIAVLVVFIVLSFIFIGLPVLALGIIAAYGVNKIGRLLLKSNTSAQDSGSTIVHNEKIGPYRVIENPNDPSVIEIEKL